MINRILICLALLQSHSLITKSSIGPNAERGWLYIGKGVRMISFRVNADATAEKNIFIPDHKSGFILLSEHSFSVSVASAFDTVRMTYENGILETNEAGDFEKKTKTEIDYQSALLEALDKCVDQEMSRVVRDILSKRANEAPPTPTERSGSPFEKTICEFDGSWSALKRATFLWPDPQKGFIRIACDFEVMIPRRP